VSSENYSRSKARYSTLSHIKAMSLFLPIRYPELQTECNTCMYKSRFGTIRGSRLLDSRPTVGKKEHSKKR
jgi:hypothetical protein